MGDFPYADWLTRQYKQRAEATGHWVDYLKAHGLANFCLNKDAVGSRRLLLYKIEESWYRKESPTGKHPLSYSKQKEMTREHKKLLQDYRTKTKTEFQVLEKEGSHLDFNLFGNDTMGRALIFSDHVEAASESTTQGLVEFTRVLIEASVKNLEIVCAVAPCEFAVIALGSIAKGEATPFSDLEYAFIVEQYSEYFTQLAMESYFRIGNIGETPLSSFNIQELQKPDIEPETKELPAIIDHTRVGYRIDGIEEWSGNVPTGNGLVGGEKLTHTVDDLMTLYKKDANKKFEELADKSDLLSSSILIYANREISSLYNDFRASRIHYENEEAKHSSEVIQSRVDAFAEDLKKYTFVPEFIKYQPPNNRDVKIKENIFRYPTLLANNIKMCLGLDLCTSWEIYKHLTEKKILSRKNYLYIRIVLALSIYLRNKAYLDKGSKVKFVAITTDDSNEKSPLSHIPTNLFVILGSLLHPLKKSIAVSNLQLMVADAAACVTLLLDNITVDDTDFMQMVEVCYFAGEYKVADDRLNKEIKHVIRDTRCVRLLKTVQKCLLNSDSREKKFLKYLKAIKTLYGDKSVQMKYVELYAYLLYHTEDYESAVDCFKYLINATSNENHLMWILLAAHCLQQVGDYIACRHLLNRIEMSELKATIRGKCIHQDVSHRSRNIGDLYYALGNYETSLEYYHNARRIDINLHTGSGHVDLAKDFSRIGNSYTQNKEFAKGLKYHNKALDTLKTLGEQYDGNCLTARIYFNIADTYSNLGEFKSAELYHQMSLNIRINIFGDKINHTEIIDSYIALGVLNSQMGIYKTALQYLKSSWRMCATFKSGVDLLKARIFTSLGDTYVSMRQYSTAVEYYHDSLVLRRGKYGTGAVHPDIAQNLSNLGNGYKETGNFKLMMENLYLSLEMRKEIYASESNPQCLASIYKDIGQAYDKIEDYRAATDYYKDAVKLHNDIYGIHQITASCYSDLGNTYLNMENFNTALECHEKCLKIEKTIYGANANHIKLAESYSSIGKVYCAMKKHSISLEYHNHSLEMRQELCGSDATHPYVAAGYSNIGEAYENMAKYKTALEYYTFALRMREMHRTTAIDLVENYTNIGDVRSNLGEHTQALEYYETALGKARAAYGSEANHPNVAVIYSNIGDVYQRMKKHVTALEWFNKSLNMRLELYGGQTNHPEISESYLAVGTGNIYINNWVQALKYLKMSLAVAKSLYVGGHKTAWLAFIYFDVGLAYTKMDQHTAALESYHASLGIWESINHKKDHQAEIASCYQSIGDLHKVTGEYSQALSYYNMALGKNSNSKSSFFHVKIGDVYTEKRDYTTAVEYYKTALRLQTENQGAKKNYCDIATSYSRIGNAYIGMRNYTKALAYYKQLLTTTNQLDSSVSTHPAIAKIYTAMGNAYYEMAQYANALKYHKMSLEKDKAVYGVEAQHPDIAIGYSNVGQTYTRMNEHEAALRWFAKSVDMRLSLYGAETNHPDVAECYTNMGTVYYNMENEMAALKYYRKGLDILEEAYVCSANNQKIATSYCNIGKTFSMSKCHREALKHHLRCLELRETLCGFEVNHPLIAASLQHVGDAYTDIGFFKEGLIFYQDALDVTKASACTSAFDFAIAKCYARIGIAHEKLGNSSLASLYKKNSEKMNEGLSTLKKDICNSL